MKNNKILFDKIGGMQFLNSAIEVFYEKVLKDDKINHFFYGTDMRVQASKLKTFLAFAFGYPMQYTGKKMREAHASMNLAEEHFDAVASHLVNTLKELEVAQELIDEVIKIALSTKNDVLGIDEEYNTIKVNVTKT